MLDGHHKHALALARKRKRKLLHLLLLRLALGSPSVLSPLKGFCGTLDKARLLVCMLLVVCTHTGLSLFSHRLRLIDKRCQRGRA